MFPLHAFPRSFPISSYSPSAFPLDRSVPTLGPHIPPRVYAPSPRGGLPFSSPSSSRPHQSHRCVAIRNNRRCRESSPNENRTFQNRFPLLTNETSQPSRFFPSRFPRPPNRTATLSFPPPPLSPHSWLFNASFFRSARNPKLWTEVSVFLQREDPKGRRRRSAREP